MHPDWVYCGSLADDLAPAFDLTRHTAGTLTNALLADYEAVILPGLDEGLLGSELVALQAFMEGGGGVLFLGGSESVVDAFSIPYGIDYDGRTLFEIGGDGDYQVSDFANHAAVQGVTQMITNWDGSVEVSGSAERLMTSPAGSVYRDLDDDMVHDSGEPTGPFDLAAAYASGDARLVVQGGSPYQDHGYASRQGICT